MAAAVVSTAAAAAMAPAGGLVHPSDVSGFDRYVDTYVAAWSNSLDPGGPRRDRAWVSAHPDQVLAEGYRACRWLALRPDAGGIDPSGRTSTGTLTSRYLEQTETERPSGLSAMGRRTLVTAAWAHLCQRLRDQKTTPTGGPD